MKDYVQAAEMHLKAAETGTFDYPTGTDGLTTREDIFRALADGKTIEAVYDYCIAKYGTVTGAVLNSVFHHTSASTRKAVRKGMKIFFANMKQNTQSNVTQ